MDVRCFKVGSRFAGVVERLGASARPARPAAVLFACVILSAMTANASVDLMPLPSAVRLSADRCAVTDRFSAHGAANADGRVGAALARFLRRLEERSGLIFSRTPEGGYEQAKDKAQATLVIETETSSSPLPQLGEDESYTLEVGVHQIALRAPTSLGALRGLETLQQLLQSDSAGWFFAGASIRDQPRFRWRGLLIDVSRHWQPIEVIKRNLDGMALVKLNVLHLHLSDDQGFRVEIKRYPRLHQLGSDGHFFTPEQLREIVAYAAERGIRVIPEFDIPGHAQSWVVGYPALASAPGPYAIERHWGVFDAVLDPTNEDVYTMLDAFVGEMAVLFPDPYFHIGGDENNGKQWSGNPRIQKYIQEHDLKDNAGLHAYFNRRVQQILVAHGKKLIGWDEILHPELPKSAVIQSWRGTQGLADASHAGHAVILSNGYYIDLAEPASKHYLNDPLPANTPLSPQEQGLVLGGEATMWSEWVSPETIDSRIWPRTAAIAERLWSAREIVDVDDMYRRLAIVSRRLTEAGLQHETYREPMLRRYAGDRASSGDLTTLRELVAWLEPVKGYSRSHAQNHLGPSQFLPLTGLVDLAAPDSGPAREFARAVEGIAFGDTAVTSLSSSVARWKALAARLQTATAASAYGARSPEIESIASQLKALATIADEVVAMNATEIPATWRAEIFGRIDALPGPAPVVELPVATSLKILAVAVADREQRRALAPEAWRHHVMDTAVPPPNP